MSLFPELIQVALGAKASLSISPTADAWGELLFLGKEAKPRGRMFCWCAEVAKATAITSGDAVPEVDGYGSEDSAEE